MPQARRDAITDTLMMIAAAHAERFSPPRRAILFHERCHFQLFSTRHRRYDYYDYAMQPRCRRCHFRFRHHVFAFIFAIMLSVFCDYAAARAATNAAARFSFDTHYASFRRCAAAIFIAEPAVA